MRWRAVLVLALAGALLAPAAFVQEPAPGAPTAQQRTERERLEIERLRKEIRRLDREHDRGFFTATNLALLGVAVPALIALLTLAVGSASQRRQRRDEQFTAIVQDLAAEEPVRRLAGLLGVRPFLGLREPGDDSRLARWRAGRAEAATRHYRPMIFRLARELSRDRGAEIRRDARARRPAEPEPCPHHLAQISDNALGRTFAAVLRAHFPRLPTGRERRGELDLKEAYLSGGDLSRLDLQSIPLNGALLEDARLTESVLDSVDLRRACLRRVRAERASLVQTRLEDSNLQAARLIEARMPGARMHGAVLVSAELRRTDLRRAWFSHAALQAAHLDGADIRGAHFEGADLNDAYFCGVTVDDDAVESILRADNWDQAYYDPDLRARLGGGQECGGTKRKRVPTPASPSAPV
jgi:uncharacterized protein YjbI with pentapeptide repeats